LHGGRFKRCAVARVAGFGGDAQQEENDRWRVIHEVRPRTSKAQCGAASAGPLKRGKGGRGGKVKSRKQAIAIGLSEARKKGKKVPRKSKK